MTIVYGYVCFYGGKRLEIRAASLYAAKQEAVKQFKVSPKKAHMVSVMLAETPGGETVVHSTAEL